MWCYNLTKNHGLLLLIYIIVGIDSLSSSTTDCKCPSGTVQNARCSKQTNCTWVCNDGYWGTDCRYGRIRLTSSRGYITDGVGNYPKLSKRMWLIDSGNRVNATIHFRIEQLFTECNWDHLYIFDGDSTDAPPLAAFNGYLVGDVNSSSYGRIPQEIIAMSGKAYIYFYSDLGVVESGFNISYRIIDNCSCLNGNCSTAGLCVCNKGWTGRFCDVQNNCSCINGVCNQTFGICVCNDGFTGGDCSQAITSSFWTSVKTENSGVEISPRSSHTAAIIGDHMWVYNGYRFSHPGHGAHRNLYRYHLKDKTWTSLLPEENDYTWGHSMIAYQGKLIVFGGEREDYVILNTLTVYDTNSSKWSYPSLNSTPLAVTGHTATLVEDKMIVIFGLSADGIFPGVQEYDIGKSTWQIIRSKSALGVARHGHSSVYDPFSKRIYVYGGVTMPKTSSSPPALDTLMAYHPHSRKWITLASSKFRQTLHSAVILDRMMIVFGGNPYDKDTGKTCHTAKLHVYDLACQKWYSEDLPQIAQTLSRYGHTAVAKGRTMYIFGGFNGAFFNDVLTYTHGACERILNETECMEKYFSSGCYWNNSQCVNKDSLKTLPQCPGKHEKMCSEIKNCDECGLKSKCGWFNNSCKINGNETCPKSSEDICLFYSGCQSCQEAGCYWNSKNKCIKRAAFQQPRVCSRPCTAYTTQTNCLEKSCLWCENIQRCVDNRLYTIFYPYGQCFEWVNSGSSDKAISCPSKSTCRDCLTLPDCGWSESVMKNGAGQCLKGSAYAPKDVANYKYWHFFDCPLCQCNGHSNCSANSSVCLACQDHTTGANCDKCVDGYFGNPHNGGKCMPCQCNGHADTCNPRTGDCTCRMRGVEGKNCERCNSAQYVGNATNGGYCYYRLTADYLYKINVSDKLIFNFICFPNESDKNTVVTVSISKEHFNPSNPALLNVSLGSDSLQEFYSVTNVDLSSEYEQKFSKDDYPFGSENFYFKIYVYNLTPYSTVSVSVHQPNEGGINLLQFFIIFLACFVGLLLIAVVFWKVKSFFDTFRRTRRRNVELVYMTNRPFAPVHICIDKPGHVPMKSKPSPLTSEICYGNKAAVVSVLVRLPICAQTENSTGAAALCFGSTLVNYNEHQGSKMVNYMKNIKRRRNPFRSSAV